MSLRLHALLCGSPRGMTCARGHPHDRAHSRVTIATPPPEIAASHSSTSPQESRSSSVDPSWSPPRGQSSQSRHLAASARAHALSRPIFCHVRIISVPQTIGIRFARRRESSISTLQQELSYTDSMVPSPSKAACRHEAGPC